MPYWIQSTLAATPAFAAIFFGLGIPYALVLLPRHDWGRRVEVVAVAFAVAPALLTAYMFALSTLGIPLTAGSVLGGVALMILVGVVWVWRKAQTTHVASITEPSPRR
ncbi:MAG: hypothetical protein IAE80_27025, partial [Anaerolinea sp.]|nr:hypothetical protein [Anaerolinea sp.]